MTMMIDMPGKEAKPKVSVNARVDQDAIEKLDQMAEVERRSRSELIDFAVQEYIDRHYAATMSKAKK